MELLPPTSPPLLEELLDDWPPLELFEPPELPALAEDAAELLPPPALDSLPEPLPPLPPVDPEPLSVSDEQAPRPPLSSPETNRTPRRRLCVDAMFPPSSGIELSWGVSSGIQQKRPRSLFLSCRGQWGSAMPVLRNRVAKAESKAPERGTIEGARDSRRERQKAE